MFDLLLVDDPRCLVSFFKTCCSNLFFYVETRSSRFLDLVKNNIHLFALLDIIKKAKKHGCWGTMLFVDYPRYHLNRMNNDRGYIFLGKTSR